MMSVLAFDPGPTRTGAALVALDEQGFTLLRWGHLPWTGGYTFQEQAHPFVGQDVLNFLDDAARMRSTVAIETIRGTVYPGRAAEPLFETRTAEGALIYACVLRGIHPSLYTAQDWRCALTGDPTASDVQIAMAVRGLLLGLPESIPPKESAHLFDAAGMASVILAHAIGTSALRLLPQQVVENLFDRQSLEKERRQAARAKKVPR